MQCLTKGNLEGTDSEKDLFSNFFEEPSIDGEIFTPTNITGMYQKLIRTYLSGTKYSRTEVVPALNKEAYLKHKDPIVAVQRGSISPTGMGVMGGKAPIPAGLPSGLPNADGYSEGDSLQYTHIQSLQVVIYVFTENLAEAEAISYMIHKLLTAYGNDVLSKYAEAIKHVSLPETSSVSPDVKYTSKYIGTISFNVTFQDETILLIHKNMLKYLRITVSEKESVNVISLDERKQ